MRYVSGKKALLGWNLYPAACAVGLRAPRGGKAEMVGRLREEQEGTRVDSGGHRKVPSERYFHALFSALGLKEH